MDVGKSFSCSSVGKESALNAGDLSSIPGSGKSPGEEMATHASILPGIPWTEEPDTLQSMGSQRVGHDLASKPPPPCMDVRVKL